MPVFKNYKCIFVHIPKCAGTSIYKTLIPDFNPPHDINQTEYGGWDSKNKIWKQHAMASQIIEFYCPDFNDYFSFAFVRNPWDRSVSDYFWMKKALNVEDSFKNFLKLSNKFNTPRLSYPHLNGSGRGDHLLAQSDFIFDSNGNQIVNYIGKFENLQEDFNTICDKIGIPQQQLPHINKSKNKHYTEYYDDETRKIVAEKYAKDIEYFGYKFGD